MHYRGIGVLNLRGYNNPCDLYIIKGRRMASLSVGGAAEQMDEIGPVPQQRRGGWAHLQARHPPALSGSGETRCASEEWAKR